MLLGERTLELMSPPMEGDDVFELQVPVVAFGERNNPVPCDGKFGSSTEKAVRRFQKTFSLEETGKADATVVRALEQWTASSKAVMEEFLEGYKCKHGNVAGLHKTSCDKLWADYIKDQVDLTSGAKAGDAPICAGFGNGLTKVVLTKHPRNPDNTLSRKGTYDFLAYKNLAEHDGIDKILFWLIMGVLKIYNTSSIQVNNGYRCQYKYWRINKDSYGAASMDNHTGHAVDFLLPGATIKRPDGSCLAVSRRKRRHCDQIRDDLKDCGVVETFDPAPKNRPRTEPRAAAKTWVHLDTTVYERHVYVKTWADAVLGLRLAPSCSLPIDLGFSTDVTLATIEKCLGHIEKDKRGGYYPIGANTIWHGGVHLKPASDSEVFAVLPGKIIAARLPADKDLAIKEYGSRNFVLLEHKHKEQTFFSLYMHLANIPLSSDNEVIKKIKWLEEGDLDALKSGEVVKLDRKVAAGELLWRSGEYGWGSSRAKLLHFGVFSETNILDQLGSASSSAKIDWLVVEDSGDNYNVDTAAITSLFPKEMWEDENVTMSELIRLYRDNPEGNAAKLRFSACKFVDEWGISDLEAVAKALASRGYWLPHQERDIEPYLFWREARDKGVDLPASPHVWHYHPLILLGLIASLDVGAIG